MHFFFVLTPPSPSTLQHFLFQIFFNFSCLPFSFELTKKPFLSLDLVPTPKVAILKDYVTSVATLCAVEMRNAIQGNDLKLSISPFWLGHRSEEKTFVARFQPRPQGAFPWLWSGREKPFTRFRSLKKLTLISVRAMKDGPTRQ